MDKVTLVSLGILQSYPASIKRWTKRRAIAKASNIIAGIYL